MPGSCMWVVWQQQQPLWSDPTKWVRLEPEPNALLNALLPSDAPANLAQNRRFLHSIASAAFFTTTPQRLDYKAYRSGTGNILNVLVVSHES